MTDETKLDCPPLPDNEARDAMIEALKKENESFRHQLFSAREKAAKWKRKYYEERNKK